MKRRNEPIAVDPFVSYDAEIQDLLADVLSVRQFVDGEEN
jgi:hypothetical protein